MGWKAAGDNMTKDEATIMRKVINQCQHAITMRRRLVSTNVKPEQVKIFVMLKVEGRKPQQLAS